MENVEKIINGRIWKGYLPVSQSNIINNKVGPIGNLPTYNSIPYFNTYPQSFASNDNGITNLTTKPTTIKTTIKNTNCVKIITTKTIQTTTSIKKK